MVLFKPFKQDVDSELKAVIMRNLAQTEIVNRKGRLYASDSLCHKQSVINASAVYTRDLDASFKFYTESGITCEKIIKAGLGESLLFEEYELPDIGINLGGRVDGLITYKNRIWCAEIKQVGLIPTKPLPSHESQAMIYSAVTGFPSLIIYVDRKIKSFDNPLLLKVFELDNSFENRNKFLQRVVLSNLYIKNKLVPKKPDYMLKSHCNYCNYFDNCWGSEILALAADYEMYGWEFANSEQTATLQSTSLVITKQLLDSVIVNNRITGILKFLETHGRKHVKDLLKDKDWNIYLNL